MTLGRTVRGLFWVLALLAVVVGVAAVVDPLTERPVASIPTSGDSPGVRVNEPIQPIPSGIELDPSKVALGERLFHEPRLSSDGSVSCASCHNLALGGVDRRPRSVGVQGRLGSINAPTVLNSSLNFRQFWNGRAESLEDQLDGPIENPSEMDMTWPQVLAVLRSDPTYVSAFTKSYDDGITEVNVRNAIATFERSLLTPNAPFDRYLLGEQQAIDDKAKEGYALFKGLGCVSCHQGVAVGGNMYQKFGVAADYFAQKETIEEVDLGRFAVTGDDRDRHVFKVPSLRNVAATPPYFHDGSVESLEEAIAVMGQYQLGRPLGADEIELLAAFLQNLTGEYRGRPVAP